MPRHRFQSLATSPTHGIKQLRLSLGSTTVDGKSLAPANDLLQN